MTRKQQIRAAVDVERRRQLGLRSRDVVSYCRGTTKLGEPCRWRAQASGFCATHERQQLVA